MIRRAGASTALLIAVLLLASACSSTQTTLRLTTATSDDATTWSKLNTTVQITSRHGGTDLRFEGPCGTVEADGLTRHGDSLKRSAKSSTAATGQGCIGNAGTQRAVLQDLLTDDATTYTVDHDLRRLTITGARGKLLFE